MIGWPEFWAWSAKTNAELYSWDHVPVLETIRVLETISSGPFLLPNGRASIDIREETNFLACAS
jgi:hypothetical protein